MTITSPKELTLVVNSKANKLAKAAIDLIKSGGPLVALEALVKDGCPHAFIERSSDRPRSSFYTRHVLDACFESRFGIISQEKLENGTLTKLGCVHQSVGREVYFAYLLEAGFTPGVNGWRGALFPHILNSCFNLREPEAQKSALKFARILLEAGKVNIQDYVRHHYEWVGSIEHFEIALSLGAIPDGSDMIDRALGSVGCSPNAPYTGKDRTDVIARLLAMGAIPTNKSPHEYPADRHQYKALSDAGLLQKMIEFGAISPIPPYQPAQQMAA